jgi:hypothetical protein
MENKEQLIQDVLKGMEGIGGIPSNQEFYSEFDFRLRSAFGIESSQPINNMENKEQNTGMSLEQAAVDYIAEKPERAREYGLVYNAIKFGASWQSSQPIKPKMSLQECKIYIAQQHDCDTWQDLQKKYYPHFPNKLYDDVAELYASQPINSGWVSVEERFPDNGRTVLVADTESGIVDTGFNAFDQKNRFVANTVMTVTHWKELPQPPKQ